MANRSEIDENNQVSLYLIYMTKVAGVKGLGDALALSKINRIISTDIKGVGILLLITLSVFLMVN